jgi:hypothetical protein
MSVCALVGIYEGVSKCRGVADNSLEYITPSAQKGQQKTIDRFVFMV